MGVDNIGCVGVDGSKPGFILSPYVNNAGVKPGVMKRKSCLKVQVIPRRRIMKPSLVFLKEENLFRKQIGRVCVIYRNKNCKGGCKNRSLSLINQIGRVCLICQKKNCKC